MPPYQMLIVLGSWMGQKRAGEAVTTDTEVIWAQPLPPGTSAQQAELIALTHPLTWAKDWPLMSIRTVGMPLPLLTCMGLYKYQEKGLLAAEGKTIKNKEEILQLLKAYGSPRNLPLFILLGTRKAPLATGNKLADRTAKSIRSIALQDTTTVQAAILPEPPDPNLPSVSQ